MKILDYLKASGSFCWSICGGKEKFSVLKEPERPLPRRAKLSLYCYEGPALGQTFFIDQENAVLSPFVGSDKVLTPALGSEMGSYTIELEGHPLLRCLNGPEIVINQRRAHQSELFDYDEVELIGNKFVVFMHHSPGASL